MDTTSKPFDPFTDYYTPRIRSQLTAERPVTSFLSNPNGASASITWSPNYDEFQKRAQIKANNITDVHSSLPAGWPHTLSSSLVWSGSEMDYNHCVLRLTDTDKFEIQAALNFFKGLNLEIGDLNRSVFPLPTVSLKLEQYAETLYSGKGFCVIRGLDSRSYSREDNVLIYLGISSYFGEDRGRQTQSGLMMSHITDVKFESLDNEMRRPIFTNSSQPFHTDLLCSILAMFFLDTAARGGEIKLASSWKVYNELASQRPDLIKILSHDDWVHDTFGRSPSYHKRSLLHYWKKKMVLIFSRRNLTGSEATPRSQGIPPMSEDQAEALDAVHFTAAAHCATITPEPGDMIFINNFAIMHSRNAFEDDDMSKRYILRLWLNNPDKCWEVPPGLSVAWARIFSDDPDIQNYWDIEPYIARGRSLCNIEGSIQEDGSRTSRITYCNGGNGGGNGGGGGGGGGGSPTRSTSCG